MSPTLPNIIEHLLEIAIEKQTGLVMCCWCNNRSNIIKHGTYQRYAFSTNKLVDIQRYCCKNDGCRRTFSILPHPFLRITRFSLCMFKELLRLFELQVRVGCMLSIFFLNWASLNPLIQKGKEIFSWIDEEVKADPVWAPSPCMTAGRFWSDFIRMFAVKFYPKRYGSAATTEYVY